jgi:hydroxyacylglutathione hydrolase
MHLRQFVIEGLGHLSALVADESKGVAAVIDPRRDVDVYLDEAGTRGLRITHVAETHLHNDYVSGAHELATLTGAEHVIGAGADLGHPYRALRQADQFDVGAVRFTTLETPGHTPEHVAYTVADRTRADDPLVMFTGGSLLVGAVGRTDLLGADRAESYARDMYASLHEQVLPHPDHVLIHPTHGGGSLCSKSISSTRSRRSSGPSSPTSPRIPGTSPACGPSTRLGRLPWVGSRSRFPSP